MTAEPETIAAIATAPGEGGIGIVRASGPLALSCALAVFRPFHGAPEPRRATYGEVREPGSGERLDDALLTWFPAPHSYTGEEVAEISCHGSPLVLAAILRGMLAAGARLARPGEFTERAFMHGRLDLAEAEAVIDVIRARTTAALRVAARQRAGRLSTAIRELRERLIALRAEIEASIDFPDDVDPLPDDEIARHAREVRDRAQSLLATAPLGRLYREGAALVLAGRPNTGKSSLLNALLGEARSIVADVPGTTRDTIEESLELDGIPVRAVDTAGLRDTCNPIERQGVERARAQVEAADLVVWVVEAPAGLTADDLAVAPMLAGRPLVVAANKCDLGSGPPIRFQDTPLSSEPPVFSVSALTGEGLSALRAGLASLIRGAACSPESLLVSNVRHEASLRAAAERLDLAIAAARAGFDHAAISADLAGAAAALGEITGDTVAENTIEQIFARFCVGK